MFVVLEDQILKSFSVVRVLKGQVFENCNIISFDPKDETECGLTGEKSKKVAKRKYLATF